MHICKEILTKDEVKGIVNSLQKAEWYKGTSKLDEQHKDNSEYLDENLSNLVAEKIRTHPQVYNNALINNLVLPRFNKYDSTGQHYSSHVDFFKQHGVRTDWSMTLFLAEPDTYEGGELVIEDLADKPLEYKLSAGDMILYPSGLIHHVNPVTSGTRLCVISWGQSEIEDFRDRAMVCKLATVLRELEADDLDKHKRLIVMLSSVYNGLLKKWSK